MLILYKCKVIYRQQQQQQQLRIIYLYLFLLNIWFLKRNILYPRQYQFVLARMGKCVIKTT